MIRHVVLAASLTAAVLRTFLPAAAATERAIPCSDGSLGSVASRTHAKLTPCVAKRHTLIVETTYYQNASRVGGTALAAYPEARIRYGIAPRLEAFVDSPSEIAKSGQRGAGIYFMTQTGVGIKYELGRTRNVAYSLSAESHPQLGALANLNLVPLSDVHISANRSVGRGIEFGAEAGVINYDNTHHTHLRSSALISASITKAMTSRTWLTIELASQSNVYSKSRAQSSGVFSISHMLSQRILFGLELGSAFNAQRNSKPHYLGAGFTIR